MKRTYRGNTGGNYATTNTNRSDPYYLAASFADEAASRSAYRRADDITDRGHCNLSVYRCMVIGGGALVVVIGSKPSSRMHARLLDALSGGRMVSLPDDILSLLLKRRTNMLPDRG